jgi:hypothetical protein
MLSLDDGGGLAAAGQAKTIRLSLFGCFRFGSQSCFASRSIERLFSFEFSTKTSGRVKLLDCCQAIQPDDTLSNPLGGIEAKIN